MKNVNLDIYMKMYKEIADGEMKIKHHITEYITDPQLGIPSITKVDM